MCSAAWPNWTLRCDRLAPTGLPNAAAMTASLTATPEAGQLSSRYDTVIRRRQAPRGREGPVWIGRVHRGGVTSGSAASTPWWCSR